MNIEVLYFDGCPNHDSLAPRLRDLLARAANDTAVRLRRVETAQEAERERFLGSPTVRIDSRDVDPTAADRADYGLTCRLYATADGLRGPADRRARKPPGHLQTPFARLAQRGLEDPQDQRAREARLLGERDELRRRDEPAVRVLPAQQRRRCRRRD